MDIHKPVDCRNNPTNATKTAEATSKYDNVKKSNAGTVPKGYTNQTAKVANARAILTKERRDDAKNDEFDKEKYLDEFLAKSKADTTINKPYSRSTYAKNSYLEILTTSHYGVRDPMMDTTKCGFHNFVNGEIENFDFSPDPHLQCCWIVVVLQN